MRHPRHYATLLARAGAAVSLLLNTMAAAAAPVTAEAALAAELDALLAGPAPRIEVAGISIWSTPVQRALYSQDTPFPRWTAARLAQLRAAIDDSAADGLNPADFLATPLAGAETLPRAAREILATEALARLAFTLRYGKANPRRLQPDWNYSRLLDGASPVAWIREAIEDDALPSRLAALRPTGTYYQALRAALAELRATAATGDWPTVADGPSLKPGMQDPRIADLRARLGGQPSPAADAAAARIAFDPALVDAVTAFQRRHGLAPDGVVGHATLAALNVPIARRIDQLRVNLERIRWVFRDLAPEFVAVNIAAFHAAYFVDGRLRWHARAIVGRRYRETPIFRDRIEAIELNPTWTVPPTILREDLLPQLRRDPGTLARKSLRIVDADGRPVSAGSIDWNRVTAANFPYLLRQDPGPDNALGRVKFLFPNRYAVYLHDTPARELFARPERLFSSGCIRLEDPLTLAVLLLDDPARWYAGTLEKAIASGRTVRLPLPRQVPIFLLYLTAFPGLDGALNFRRDVYARDDAVLAALDGPFEGAPPDDFSAPSLTPPAPGRRPAQ